MSNSIYVSLTGLMSFSNGLDNISNNVTNMNTNGYKKSDLLFQDLIYTPKEASSDLSGNSFNQGSGVTSESNYINFLQGEIRETGNDTDVAIDGRGLFIVKDSSGNYYYTRNGSFEYADNGDLILKSTDLRVQSLSDSGSLSNINISNSYSDPANPTSLIYLSGNLSTSGASYTLEDVVIFDSSGAANNFSIELSEDPNLIRTWNITVNDEDGNVVATDGQIAFQGNGSPAVGQNLYTFQYTPTDLPQQTITLNFGEPGTFSGVTNFSNVSELTVKEQDGYSSGGLTNTTFDSTGRLEKIYSNGNTYYGETLALANVVNYSIFRPVGNGIFVAKDPDAIIVGYAKTNGIGEIVSKSIELSNVELTEQFTDMVIIQRGYQASSQVLTATNEMIQQLIEATKSR